MKEKFFATCPKGLESLVQTELEDLEASDLKQTVAGVHFSASIQQAYKMCLWSRFASRILLPLATFRITDAASLYQGVKRIKWGDHMTVSTSFVVDFSGYSETIKHTQFAAQKIKDAIVDRFRDESGSRPSVDRKNPMLRINALLRHGLVTISIDLSGESLHRRGYRLQGGSAPIKENLAAAILFRANWPEIAKAGGCLVDPMCGSGTLLIEAMFIAADIAPGLLRTQFGFQGWKRYQPELWEPLRIEANDRAKKGKQGMLSTLEGYDNDEKSIGYAKQNIEKAGLSAFIQVQMEDIRCPTTRSIPKSKGLCICNPPYGERLEDEASLLPLYRALSKELQENFLNWEAAILTSNITVAKNMGLRAFKKYQLFNGAIPCQLLLFHVQPEWFVNTAQRPPINT